MIGQKSPKIVFWNPERRRFSGRLSKLLPIYQKVNNFGDLLAGLIAARVLEKAGISGHVPCSFEEAADRQKMLSIGSVMHFANDGDIVWGSGRNGKIADKAHHFTQLDVRMVRGPKTRKFLQERGIAVPEIYGDPGLLLPKLFALHTRDWKIGTKGISILPNLNDPRPVFSTAHLIEPRAPIWQVLKSIAESGIIVTSSLHGLVIAEAFGVPVRLLKSDVEPQFKYIDYAQGTGRDTVPVYDTVTAALDAPDHMPPIFDSELMISAFPFDVFK